ncbi:hypothetical protein AVEN_97848-1 [Araneus ventricosus]|uniref:Uncharacterized protein n=1 Tax=Araneus ventricosus TaxID=182803 RepID=A0A4Y2RLF4_ARAVE|nr:hypothetical protein AVEN_97848-1 [Araneus ventricosus]
MKDVGLPSTGLEISVLSLSLSSPKEKRALARFLSSSKILSFFLTLISLPLGERSKASPRILVNFVGGVYFSEPLLVPYFLVLFLPQAGSQAGDK